MQLKKYRLAIHIFRRDLRLQDNKALNLAIKNADVVIPCFIFDPRQVIHNAYKGQPAIQFMVHTLTELAQELQRTGGKLYYFYGKTEDVLKNLLSHLPVEAVFTNRDYTPYSRVRDERLRTICRKHTIDFYNEADALLNEPEDILKKDGTPYTVFTPFFKYASRFTIDTPKTLSGKYYHKKISLEDHSIINQLKKINGRKYVLSGGRKEALSILKKISHFQNYQMERNYPAKAGTTKLSAHLKFGTISIREVYYRIFNLLGASHPLLRQLYWRDFFTHIAFHFPHVFGKPFHLKYDHIKWSQNKAIFKKWCEGKTGFPIVDAGMRELNETGFMHNRVRMIASSFLVKDLHINWLWGEKYFAQHLIDYDPAVNNGNWQWAASTGCDAQPYFRIFNPELQQKKFDPDCRYIKKYIPELRDFSNKEILLIENGAMKAKDYYPQIVSHKEETMLFKKIWHRAI